MYIFFSFVAVFSLFAADVLLLLHFFEFLSITEQQQSGSSNTLNGINSINRNDPMVTKLRSTRILHIINPFRSEDLRSKLTQNMTMQTVLNALQHARQNEDYYDMYVEILAVMTTDTTSPPAFFNIPNEFSVLNTNLSTVDGMPKLRSILELGHAYADTNNFTHAIFTNLDISIMPMFYGMAKSLLQCSGTLLINRS